MKKELFILFFLVIMIFISGCSVTDTSQPTPLPEYKDESLKMETDVTGKVLPSQAINMKIYLTSQAEYTIRNVTLRVTDFYGLKPLTAICGDNNGDADRSLQYSLGECSTGFSVCGCHFDEILSLDEKEINFVFKVPSSEEIARIGRDLKPEFTLRYDYRGETKYLIPILDSNERSTDAKIESVETKGPIHVKIERGFTSSDDSWEREGTGFSIVVDVKDVLDSKNEIEIDRNNFSLDLTNLESDCDGDLLCHFSGDTTLNPNENITLPMDIPLVCALTSGTIDVPWVYGEINANFQYRYKVVKTEKIEVETVID